MKKNKFIKAISSLLFIVIISTSQITAIEASKIISFPNGKTYILSSLYDYYEFETLFTKIDKPELLEKIKKIKKRNSIAKITMIYNLYCPDWYIEEIIPKRKTHTQFDGRFIVYIIPYDNEHSVHKFISYFVEQNMLEISSFIYDLSSKNQDIELIYDTESKQWIFN